MSDRLQEIVLKLYSALHNILSRAPNMLLGDVSVNNIDFEDVGDWKQIKRHNEPVCPICKPKIL